MSKPLALICYSNLHPGSRLAARLQDLGYRVQTLGALAGLAEVCRSEKPFVVLAEISPQQDGRAEFAALKQNPDTAHIPVLAFAAAPDKAFAAAAREAGIALLADSGAVLEQLPQLLDQVLRLD